MTTVKTAKTAFLYYQSDKLSSIRSELGDGCSMGDAMTELARRWRSLTDEDRAPYLELYRLDHERFARESAAADAAAYEAVQAKHKEASDISGQRGARAAQQAQREINEQRRKARREAAAMDDSEEAIQRREAAAQKKAEAAQRRAEREQREKELRTQHKKLDKEQAKKAQNRLEYLFAQSNIFAKLQGGKGALPGADDEEKPAAVAEKCRHLQKEDGDEADAIDDDVAEDKHVFLTKQPSVIRGGTLKPYQVESLNWMIHLAEKGLNGILADEMGLGKTVQSIAILAYHYEFLRIQGPHLICVPKSTLSNWMNELKRWCPSLRAIKFHGSREDREEMGAALFNHEAATHNGKRPDKPQIMVDGELTDDNSETPRQWDVCVTTYEVANMEKRNLGRFTWKYLIIDEAHRLKNDASMFSKTVRSFRTANRLLLTGTPLQNNLHELWALLNFLLPDIFSSAEQFDEWFDLEIDDEDAKKNIIQQLHKILRPFMLRRLKADVAKGLPPKTETILMVGMSKIQKQLYRKLLLRDIDSISGNGSRTAVLNIVMQLRKCCGHPYLFEGVEDRTLDPLGEHLVDNCGKLSLLDKLLKRLKERGNRVLIFTQMTRVLDILEDFMHMRKCTYILLTPNVSHPFSDKYCRIDGNTTYDVREGSIADFNAEGSEIFCFLLSTRAGGLGINLQTADTCVLYDSDWNPQADLQAQDRCHRLGQKRPVNVFRLVTEHTIEEKIVERAQQKLKLDAMVVQQGRLKDKDKVSKDEIMAAVRFGADSVFRSDESTITDEDIDVILERGKAKTKELTEKIQKKEKGDLLDFRLDGGISAQTFEGVDYSDKGLRDHLRMLAANSVGKRERRPPPMEYNPIIISKKSMVVNNQRIKLPKPLRVPQMEDHHFFNRERLLELGKLEFENYAALRESNNVPPRDVLERQRSLLPPELAQEKRELLAEGFETWSKSQYYNFVKGCATYGRDDLVSIANDMDMPVEEITAYSRAFWAFGATELKGEWERVVGNIERGEKKLERQKKLSALLSTFIATFENPREDMVFANRGTVHFAVEQDRALLCAVEKHGYGNWEKVREAIRNDSRLKFQHSALGMSVQSIAKRCDYRMRQMEKELDAREKAKKYKRPPAVVSAQKSIDAIKEMEEFDQSYRSALLNGKFTPPDHLSGEARTMMKERVKEREASATRLREIEGQYQNALRIAEETREQIYRGSQYVNYSNITLKAGGSANTGSRTGSSSVTKYVNLESKINPLILKIPVCGECKNCVSSTTKLCERRLEVRERLIHESAEKKVTETKKKTKKRKAEPAKKGASGQATKGGGSKSSGPPKKKKKSSATGAAAVTSKTADKSRSLNGGNRKMGVPDDLVPQIARRISAYGTNERTAVINEFVSEHLTISHRQISLKFSELCTRHRPGCIPDFKGKKTGRMYMSYLRPCFYKLLPEDERPSSWERFAEEDEVRFAEEQKAKELQKKAAPQPQPVKCSAEQDAVAEVAAEGVEDDDDAVEATEVEAIVE